MIKRFILRRYRYKNLCNRGAPEVSSKKLTINHSVLYNISNVLSDFYIDYNSLGIAPAQIKFSNDIWSRYAHKYSIEIANHARWYNFAVFSPRMNYRLFAFL